jgi:hypothetical protein
MQWNTETCSYDDNNANRDPNSPVLVDLFGIGQPDLLSKTGWKRNRGYASNLNSLKIIDLDLTGPGLWEWVGPKVGVLVYGQVEPKKVDGSVLFGNHTFGKSWEHGYAPLLTLDKDKDGVISGEELDSLWVWVDANSDALVQRGEMTPAGRIIDEILSNYNTDGTDYWQNEGVKLKDGTRVKSWDWWSKPINPSASFFPSESGGYEVEMATILPTAVVPRVASLYNWKTVSNGKIHTSGMLRFVKTKGGLYVLSAANKDTMKTASSTWGNAFPRSVWNAVFAKVKKDNGTLSWTFKSENSMTDSSEVTYSNLGREIYGKSLWKRFTSKVPYEWTGNLVSSVVDDINNPQISSFLSFTDELLDAEIEKAGYPSHGLLVLPDIGGDLVDSTVKLVPVGELE